MSEDCLQLSAHDTGSRLHRASGRRASHLADPGLRRTWVA